MKSKIFLYLVIMIVLLSCDKNITDRTSPTGLSPSGTNKAPVVNAGPDITLDIPRTSTTLSGSASDVNNDIKAYRWRKISGPDSYFLEWPDQASAKLIWMEEGEYAFELSVTNRNSGLTGKDTVLVTVSSKLKKLILTNIAYDNSGFLKAEIPPDVIANIEWVFCKAAGRCEGADNGPSPTMDYNWGGYYYELLPGNRISVFGGYNDVDTVDIIIYYSE